jgi:hypothetical protein
MHAIETVVYLISVNAALEKWTVLPQEFGKPLGRRID